MSWLFDRLARVQNVARGIEEPAYAGPPPFFGVAVVSAANKGHP